MYTAFYELKEEPFRLTPDPRFLHLAEPHRAVLATLLEGVLLRKGFVVVTGPIGTGKTTLLHAAMQILMDRAPSKTSLASAFFVNPTLSRDEFFEALLEEFEVSCSSGSKPQRLLALHQMLLDTQKQGGTAILLIDEAHLLSPELLEEIRLLNNTETYREKLLQIVLCGQPELWSLLRRPDMRALQQRISSRGQLRALSVAETRAYIAERLHAAGLRAASPFPHATLEAIHQYAEGIPRLINLLCDRCLTIGFENQARQIGVAIVQEAAFDLELSLTPQNEEVEPSASTKTEARATERSANIANILVQAPPPGEKCAPSAHLSAGPQDDEGARSAQAKLTEIFKTAQRTPDTLIQPMAQDRVPSDVSTTLQNREEDRSGPTKPFAGASVSDSTKRFSVAAVAQSRAASLDVPMAPQDPERYSVPIKPRETVTSTMDILIRAMKQSRAMAQE